MTLVTQLSLTLISSLMSPAGTLALMSTKKWLVIRRLLAELSLKLWTVSLIWFSPAALFGNLILNLMSFLSLAKRGQIRQSLKCLPTLQTHLNVELLA